MGRQCRVGTFGGVTDEREHLRRCLIRQLLRWRAERGDDWMRGFVADWKRWPGLREDFRAQWAAGNRGALGDWR